MLVQDFTSASRSPWANLFYVFQLCPSWKQLGLDIVFNLWIFRNSLVFQIAPVCGLSMLHFPAQVLYLCFQLCLLVFKLKLMNYQIKHFRESWKSSNLPILSWDRALCSRRRDMCTAECTYTWPAAWQRQTDTASLSRSHSLPSPSPGQRKHETLQRSVFMSTYCDSVFDFLKRHSLEF